MNEIREWRRHFGLSDDVVQKVIDEEKFEAEPLADVEVSNEDLNAVERKKNKPTKATKAR